MASLWFKIFIAMLLFIGSLVWLPLRLFFITSVVMVTYINRIEKEFQRRNEK